MIAGAAARPPLLAFLLVGGIADCRTGECTDPGADQRAGGAVAAAGNAVAGDTPHEPADNRAAHCAPPATAAFHFRFIMRVVPAAIIGIIISGRRRIAGAMALDSALITAFVNPADRKSTRLNYRTSCETRM